MGDLSTIDETKPDNSELARLGAGRIRDLELATKTSFGVEHSLVGYHKFLTGSQAVRPAAGNPGRIFINTTDNRVERDDGSIWQQLHAVSFRVQFETTDIVVPGASFVDVATMNVDMAAGSAWFAICSVALSASSGSNRGVVGRVRRGSFTTQPTEQTWFVDAGTTPSMYFYGVDFAPVVGVNAITLQISCALGATLHNRHIMLYVV